MHSAQANLHRFRAHSFALTKGKNTQRKGSRGEVVSTWYRAQNLLLPVWQLHDTSDIIYSDVSCTRGVAAFSRYEWYVLSIASGAGRGHGSSLHDRCCQNHSYITEVTSLTVVFLRPLVNHCEAVHYCCSVHRLRCGGGGTGRIDYCNDDQFHGSSSIYSTKIATRMITRPGKHSPCGGVDLGLRQK